MKNARCKRAFLFFPNTGAIAIFTAYNSINTHLLL